MGLNAEATTESREENYEGDIQENLGQTDSDSSFQLVNALVARPEAGPLLVIRL